MAEIPVWAVGSPRIDRQRKRWNQFQRKTAAPEKKTKCVYQKLPGGADFNRMAITDFERLPKAARDLL